MAEVRKGCRWREREVRDGGFIRLAGPDGSDDAKEGEGGGGPLGPRRGRAFSEGGK